MIACQAPQFMGILQARILEWVPMPSSRSSSQPRDWTHVSYVSCIRQMGSLPLPPPVKSQCSPEILPILRTFESFTKSTYSFFPPMSLNMHSRVPTWFCLSVPFPGSPEWYPLAQRHLWLTHGWLSSPFPEPQAPLPGYFEESIWEVARGQGRVGIE